MSDISENPESLLTIVSAAEQSGFVTSMLITLPSINSNVEK
jgi:hypothetical protein